MRMRWMSLLFAHWPVPADEIRPLIPGALEIDTFDGDAWVGLVPFTMRNVGHTLWPWVPTMRHFHECNVRTYVTCNGVPGVWFFSLDATSRLAVWGARRFWHLNYQYSRMDLQREGDVVRYSVDRAGHPGARLRCTWRAGRPMPRSQPGELAHFLTERYSLFTIDSRGRPQRGRIWHEPWPLREAEMLEFDDGLVRAAGVAIPDQRPVLYHVDALDMEAWDLEAC